MSFESGIKDELLRKDMRSSDFVENEAALDD